MAHNVVEFLVGIFGSQREIAEAAKVTQPTVAGWKASNSIPFKRIPKLLAFAEKNGLELKADDLVKRSWGRQ
jgi:transcriptional regulator with XRE-family HTH domain